MIANLNSFAILRSLRARLILLWVIIAVASVIAGILMLSIFRQSTQAQIERADAIIARSCAAIGRNYLFYTINWTGPTPPLDDVGLRQALTSVVQVALRDQNGVEGGIWQSEAGSMAYAYPTYEGTGPKTDLPAAELPRIRTINDATARDDYGKSQRFDARSQTLLLHSCPLAGVIAGLTAWTMTRVSTSAGQGISEVRLGLGVLIGCVLSATALLSWLLVSWTRQVGRIEAGLRQVDHQELPALALTGEPELDRIVTALNQAGTRLREARSASAAMARQMATSERLTAIGRMTAAFAHEIRNPIAAMRLKAENALAGDDARRQRALDAIIAQITRLDRLVAQLLTASHRKEAAKLPVPIERFFASIFASYGERARAQGVALLTRATVDAGNFDPDMMETALNNLVLNALQHVHAGGEILVEADEAAGRLRLRVRDTGPGIPAEMRDSIFEPFVTGRADGTGLGLSIVREIVESHDGAVRLLPTDSGACFEIELPTTKER